MSEEKKTNLETEELYAFLEKIVLTPGGISAAVRELTGIWEKQVLGRLDQLVMKEPGVPGIHAVADEQEVRGRENEVNEESQEAKAKVKTAINEWLDVRRRFDILPNDQ